MFNVYFCTVSIIKYPITSEPEKVRKYMLTEQEANDLMNKFIDLRAKVKETGDPKIKLEFRKHENECISKFKYLISMKTFRYKSFSNYDDLNQVGFLALIKAMSTFKQNKGSFFGWAHHYIGTSIARNANLHTAIRYPLKVAKETAPRKESNMPIQIEERFCPDKELETSQVFSAIHNVLKSLPEEQKEIIVLSYGFTGEKPMSINMICKKMNISRLYCIRTINNALSLMKENIKI